MTEQFRIDAPINSIRCFLTETFMAECFQIGKMMDCHLSSLIDSKEINEEDLHKIIDLRQLLHSIANSWGSWNNHFLDFPFEKYNKKEFLKAILESNEIDQDIKSCE